MYRLKKWWRNNKTIIQFRAVVFGFLVFIAIPLVIGYGTCVYWVYKIIT